MRRFQIDCGGLTSGEGKAIRLDVRGDTQNVRLRIDNITRRMLGNVPDLLLDLLEIAAYVYCADQRASRGSDELTNYGDHWRRDLHFSIPVRCLDVWLDAQVQEELCATLGFLSDDTYTFEFIPAEEPAQIKELYFPNLVEAAPDIDEVALFSGGLDSFAGVVNDVVQHGKSLLLVGHFSTSKVRSVQDALIEELRRRGLGRQVFFVPVWISNIDTRPVEHTQRTRSFLFACLGLAVAQMVKKTRFTFYENGVVSLNLPISGDVAGGRATRTTHPRVLRGFERLFSMILEQDISIDTPLQWMTKPEVALLLKNAGVPETVLMTCSCSRTHLRTKKHPHCGECSQCIDRRFAVLAAGLEKHEPATTYRHDLLTADRTGDVNLRLALNYVAFFNELKGISRDRFLQEYPEVASALREFPDLTTEEAQTRLYEMLQRQVDAIDKVLAKALRENAEALVKGKIPPGSLLALSQGPKNLVIHTPSNYDAQVKEFKDRLDKLGAPLLEFAVDEQNKRIVFRNGLFLGGVDFKLVKKLLPEFRAAKKERRDPECVSTPDLAEKLGKSEPSLFQQRKRLNDKLVSLATDLGIPFDTNSFIENLKGQGYRLNPSLCELSLADIEKKGLPPSAH